MEHVPTPDASSTPKIDRSACDMFKTASLVHIGNNAPNATKETRGRASGTRHATDHANGRATVGATEHVVEVGVEGLDDGVGTSCVRGALQAERAMRPPRAGARDAPATMGAGASQGERSAEDS